MFPTTFQVSKVYQMLATTTKILRTQGNGRMKLKTAFETEAVSCSFFVTDIQTQFNFPPFIFLSERNSCCRERW